MFAVGSSLFNKDFVEAVVVANPTLAANPAIQAEIIKEDGVDINGILWLIYTRSGQRFVCYTRPETLSAISQKLLYHPAPNIVRPEIVPDIVRQEIPYEYRVVDAPAYTPPPPPPPVVVVKKTIPPVKPVRIADANMTNESNRGQVVSVDEEEFSMDDIKKMTQRKR